MQVITAPEGPEAKPLHCEICGDQVCAVVALTPDARPADKRLEVCLLCIDQAATDLANRGGA